MDYNSFTSKIKTELEKQFDSSHKVVISTTLKNNDVQLDTILIQKEGSYISPNLYLEYYYEQYCEGASIEEVVEDMLVAYAEATKQEPALKLQSTDFSQCMSKIYYRLVNYEKNSSFLSKVPYVRYHDLAIVFYCLVEEQASGIQSFCINSHLCEKWGMTAKELYDIAKINTQNMFPAKLSNLADVLTQYPNIGEFGDMERTLQKICETDNADMEGPFSIYVLTNKIGVNGAAVILYPDVLRKIAESFQSDLYLLPSSIHEFLILPKKDFKTEELEAMVQEVNQTQVMSEEVLSQRVYSYNRKKHCVE